MLALALPLLVLAAPAEARRIDRCELPRAAKVEGRSDRVVVWSFERLDSDGDPWGKVVACRRSTGASMRLAETWDWIGEHNAVPEVRVAGGYAAIYQEGHDHYSTRFRTLWVFDVERRRRVHFDWIVFDPPFGEAIQGGMPALVLAPTGAVAYVVRRESDRDHNGRVVARVAVRAMDAGGRRLLDKGEGIDPASLRLDGATVSWTNGGEPRSATLR